MAGCGAVQQLTQKEEEEVRVCTPLMHLIHHHMSHVLQVAVDQQPPQQHTCSTLLMPSQRYKAW